MKKLVTIWMNQLWYIHTIITKYPMLNPSTEETQLYLNPFVRGQGQKIDHKTEDDYKNMEQVYEKTISHLHINLLIENTTLIKF